MADTALDPLEAYFARIGFRGRREPTLAALSEIQRRHVCAIPFENFDVHLGRPIKLDLPSLEQKLIHDRRGGYCFEQNTLLKSVLTTLGFQVTTLIARVRWQVPADVPTGLTHMILRVDLNGVPYLVDGGFGSGSLTAPLRLDVETEQTTPHELRRIIRRDGQLVQQSRFGEQWSDLYLFTLQPMQAIDYEVANWYTSTHPRSRFVENLTAARADEGKRFTLLNREFAIRWIDGRVEKRELSSRADLLDVLAKHFTLSFSADTRFGRLSDALWPETMSRIK